MRLYTQTEEENIRTSKLARKWEQSGLLDAEQARRLAADLKVNLQRTNLFLRIVLFAFGALIAAASVGLSIVVLRIDGTVPLAILFFLSAGMCFRLAERFTRRVYRFGVEESLAVSAIVLAGLGAGVLSSNEMLAGLLAAAAAALVVYLRFGYVYAAFGSMACLAGAVFQIGQSGMVERVTVVLILLPVFIIVRRKHLQHGDDFPGDNYSIIAAAAWAGIYAASNLLAFEPNAGGAFPPVFYWATYLLTWFLPATGLYLGLKDKDRALLDVNLVTALATLITNKAYLGLERRTWDPILLGALLIGTALLVRRWLANGLDGGRYGFTASRLLRSDKRALAFVGTASTAIQPEVPIPSPSEAGFKPGGGRSGGAGASGAF